MPDSKLRIYDVGKKAAPVDAFPYCCHLISWEKEQVSGESLEAARVACNKFFGKRNAKDSFHMRIRVHPHHVLRFNKMLTCAGADRLQTGMRGAFGKPMGLAARVSIGQVLMSVRCKDSVRDTAHEALRRSKFKFPGRQKIVESRNWGFTGIPKSDYLAWKAEGRLRNKGVHVEVLGRRGPLTERKEGEIFDTPARIGAVAQH